MTNCKFSCNRHFTIGARSVLMLSVNLLWVLVYNPKPQIGISQSMTHTNEPSSDEWVSVIQPLEESNNVE
jgi:hypothetical protein